jgi:hypothetical protein
MPRLRLAPIAAAFVLLALHSVTPLSVRADYSEEQFKADLKLFETAKLPHGDADLINFFQSRILSDNDRARLAGLIDKLSSTAYKEREQARIEVEKIGTPALPALRKVVHSNVELEIKQRAERCIKAIEDKSPNALVMAAARILKHRRAEGAVGVLLEYLAIAPDEVVEEEIFSSLYSLALVGAKLEVLPPAVKAGTLDARMPAALVDANPSRRAIAALVVARHGNVEQRQAAAKLLTDEVVAVRFRAAQGLVIAGDKTGVPALLGLLDQSPMNIALQAEDLLSLVAQDKAPAEPLGETPELRKKCQAAWMAWWDKSKDGLDLSKIEVESPFGSMVARASNGATQFVEAILLLQRKHDATMLTRVTDVPFTFVGQINLRTREEFDDFVKTQLMAQQPKEQEIKFKVLKVVPAAEYVKAAPENERGFLEASRLAQIHVVFTRVQEGKNDKQETIVPLFIRISGGRARCIGLGLPAGK